VKLGGLIGLVLLLVIGRHHLASLIAVRELLQDLLANHTSLFLLG